jgi:hypothetical protein
VKAPPASLIWKWCHKKPMTSCKSAYEDRQSSAGQLGGSTVASNTTAFECHLESESYQSYAVLMMRWGKNRRNMIGLMALVFGRNAQQMFSRPSKIWE